MDLSAMLPLLAGMNGQKNATDNSGGTMLTPEKLGVLMNAMRGEEVDRTALLSQLAGASNPQLAQIMSLANGLNAKNNQKTPPGGLKAVRSLASSDIIGRLAKYFSR